MKRIVSVILVGLFFMGIVRSEEHKRVLVITDMWEDPSKILGGTEEVVRQVCTGLRKRGHEVCFMGFADVSTFKIPFTTNTSCVWPFLIRSEIKKKIETFKPHYIFIALLGLISHDAAAYCNAQGIPFTGFYSLSITKGPEFIKANSGVPIWFARYFINSFLSSATNIVVPSESVCADALQEGFKNVITWPHGADIEKFTFPSAKEKAAAIKSCVLEGRERPFNLFVGRVSEEKNISAFLKTRVLGTKIVVGPEGRGSSLDQLRKDYPDVVFAGRQVGSDLVKYYHASDILFFPSKVDAFGLVMLEALSAGMPVVGFNTNGPRDVVPQGCGVSYLANNIDDLDELAACGKQAWTDLQAGVVTPAMCRTYASRFSWDSAIEQLEQVFVPVVMKDEDQACHMGCW